MNKKKFFGPLGRAGFSAAGSEACALHCWAKGKEPQDVALVPHAPRGKASARDVFIYFDNDMKVRAPADAARLEELAGVRHPPAG